MPENIITLQDAATLFINALIGIVLGTFFSAPITLFLVSVIKRFIPALPAAYIQWVIALILAIVFWVAQYFGLEQQFSTIVDLVLAAGPFLLTLFGGVVASSAGYTLAVKANASILGYQRSPPPVIRTVIRNG